MTTAERAKEGDRERFGVPGNVDVSMSFAPHNVIRTMDGRVCTGAGDVLEVLRAVPEKGVVGGNGAGIAAAVEALPEAARTVLRRITRTPQGLESIVSRSGLPPGAALAAVTQLEIAGFVGKSQNGGWLRLK